MYTAVALKWCCSDFFNQLLFQHNCPDLPALSNMVSITESCWVREEATKKSKQCQFPFRFKGRTHNGCIDYIDVQNGQNLPGNPWCSTRVRGSNRQHVDGGGYYGDCKPSCPGGDKGTKTTTTRRPTRSTTTIRPILPKGDNLK